MNTRPVMVTVAGLVAGVVAGLVLGGCAADPVPPDPGSSGAGSPGAPASPSAGAGASDDEKKGRTPADRTGEADDGSDGSDGGEGAEDTRPDPATGEADTDATRDGSAPALEMPEAPEPTVSSLSQLLPPANPAPLVTTPLPRAASVQGRLLSRFPDALRPTRSARVQSSSVSPSGDRLQVGLVATSSLSPEQVLRAYRTRLARRGMAETTTPPSVAGSTAAAFRRGGSVVTVTVTPRATGTSYSVHASLRAGRG